MTTKNYEELSYTIDLAIAQLTKFGGMDEINYIAILKSLTDAKDELIKSQLPY